MTCNSAETGERTWARGSTEYLKATITADVELDTQPVAFTFDRATFHTAEWTGAPGTTRTARLLVDDSMLPTENPAYVYVKVTDDPEVPFIPAGTLTVI